MIKAEIIFIFKQMNMNIRDHPYLNLEGTRGKWKFKDHRTYEDDEEIPHVFPIGISQFSIYVVNPFNGEIISHGYDATNYYTGHKSQNYIVDAIEEYSTQYKGITQIKKRMNGFKKLKRKYEIYQRRCN